MAYQPKSYRKFLATSMTAAMVATAVAPITGLAASSFPDVAEGTPYTEPINALAKMGVLAGYPDGTFKIREKVTRAEAAQVLTVLRGLDTTGAAAPFPDVKQGVWYTNAVNAVYNAKIMVGQPNGNFEPNTQLTRAEFALMVMNAYGVEAKEDAKHSFTDVVAGAWYEKAIATLHADGVIAGKTTTTFAPNEPIDRGDLAILVHFAEQKYGDGIVGDTQIKAVNNTTVEITYKEKVEAIKTSDFEISGLKVENAAIKQTDNKTVVLTTAKQKGGEKYTVKQNGKEIGKFEGISAVLPEKITVTTPSVQGILGKEVTLKADVGVKEAGIPVTFNIKAGDKLNDDHVKEVLTNEEGIAEVSYTQYSAGNDDVAVYATGAPANRGFAKVFWGVKEILAVTADDKKGDKLNNNETKTYKVQYNDPKTGKPVANRVLNITFLENVNTTVDKTTKATINGKNPVQLTNGTVDSATVTTNGNGEATFTVTGTNTKATPVVYVTDAAAGQTGDAQFTKNRLELENLRAEAKELQFGAVQLDYKIEVTRDGKEEAAIGTENGRKYNIVVKDKDGKAVTNETLHVAFSEDIDRNMNTSTSAFFTKDDKKVSGDPKHYEVTLDKEGKASFTIASDKDKDYATPIVWINTNSSNAADKNFNEGHPHQKAAITYFATAKVTEGTIEAYANDSTDKADLKKDFKGTDTVVFKYYAANQSGKTSDNFKNIDVNAEISITNNGKEVIRVGKHDEKEENMTLVHPGRTETKSVKGSEGLKVITGKDKDNGDKSTTIKVEAKGSTASNQGSNSSIYLGSKSAEAKFVSTKDIGTVHTGIVEKIDTKDEKITFVGKTEIKYKDATGFKNERGVAISKSSFETLVKDNLDTIEVTVKKDKDDKYSFEIVSLGEGLIKDSIEKFKKDKTEANLKAVPRLDLSKVPTGKLGDVVTELASFSGETLSELQEAVNNAIAKLSDEQNADNLKKVREATNPEAMLSAIKSVVNVNKDDLAKLDDLGAREKGLVLDALFEKKADFTSYQAVNGALSVALDNHAQDDTAKVSSVVYDNTTKELTITFTDSSLKEVSTQDFDLGEIFGSNGSVGSDATYSIAIEGSKSVLKIKTGTGASITQGISVSDLSKLTDKYNVKVNVAKSDASSVKVKYEDSTPVTPEVTTVNIAGGNKQYTIPVDDQAPLAGETLSATALDQDGENISTTFTWSLDPTTVDGVKINANGELKIDDTAKAGQFDVVATASNGVSTSIKVTLIQ